ncbi:MAG: hypothetical protein KKD99_12800 [Proteobacteria bacterium]|nr:hypothetical protein [Pseudomonadota bacterium]
MTGFRFWVSGSGFLGGAQDDKAASSHFPKVALFYLSVNLSMAAIYLKYEAYPRLWQGLILSYQQSAVSYQQKQGLIKSAR